MFFGGWKCENRCELHSEHVDLLLIFQIFFRSLFSSRKMMRPMILPIVYCESVLHSCQSTCTLPFWWADQSSKEQVFSLCIYREKNRRYCENISVGVKTWFFLKQKIARALFYNKISCCSKIVTLRCCSFHAVTLLCSGNIVLCHIEVCVCV